MSINVSQAHSQANQLRILSGRLHDVQSSLSMYQRNINSGWRGAEMAPVNSAIEAHIRSIDIVADEMRAIGSDIVVVAEAIRREEEEAAAAAAAAAEARAAASASIST